jgi:hypothetical protein
VYEPREGLCRKSAFHVGRKSPGFETGEGKARGVKFFIPSGKRTALRETSSGSNRGPLEGARSPFFNVLKNIL